MSFGFFLIIFFLCVAVISSSYKIDIFVYSLIFAGVVFVSFSNVAVFSYRLANICMSLYPYLIAKVLNSPSNGIFKLGTMSLLILLLTMRDGNIGILESIVSGFE